MEYCEDNNLTLLLSGGLWEAFGTLDSDKLLRFQSLISYCGILKEKNVEGNADDGVLFMIVQEESFQCEQNLLKRSCVCRD